MSLSCLLYLTEVQFIFKNSGAFCEIKKKLTSHVARHTFATTVALANGVRIEVISKMLGHTNIRTTQLYAHIYQAEVDKEFERLNNIV
ncbi:tyrosine-type recombinase/integrase [Bacteroides thetaiotaomicron]|nr:tyrosine-type recombinase/integrase [Bacteroides thetaiotaomicron]